MPGWGLEWGPLPQIWLFEPWIQYCFHVFSDGGSTYREPVLDHALEDPQLLWRHLVLVDEDGSVLLGDRGEERVVPEQEQRCGGTRAGWLGAEGASWGESSVCLDLNRENLLDVPGMMQISTWRPMSLFLSLWSQLGVDLSISPDFMCFSNDALRPTLPLRRGYLGYSQLGLSWGTRSLGCSGGTHHWGCSRGVLTFEVTHGYSLYIPPGVLTVGVALAVGPVHDLHLGNAEPEHPAVLVHQGLGHVPHVWHPPDPLTVTSDTGHEYVRGKSH